jgi:hypothetical protein
VERRGLIADTDDLVDALGPDDAYLFYYAGRVGINEAGENGPSPYLLLTSAQSVSPVIGSVTLTELGGILARRPGVTLMDLCTDSEDAQAVQTLLRNKLPSSALVALQKCNVSSSGLLANAVSSSELKPSGLTTAKGRSDALRSIGEKVPSTFRGALN